MIMSSAWRPRCVASTRACVSPVRRMVVSSSANAASMMIDEHHEPVKQLGQRETVLVAQSAAHGAGTVGQPVESEQSLSRCRLPVGACGAVQPRSSGLVSTAAPPSGATLSSQRKLRRLRFVPLSERLSSAQICHVPNGRPGSNSAPPVVPGTLVTKPVRPLA